MKTQKALELLKKYNIPGPRYTSYPTYPVWTGITPNSWFKHFQDNLQANPTLSFYIHVPFCKTLCAFCGCTKMITKDYSKADEYIDALHKEFYHYEKMIPEGTKVFEIHLGGGSPSWLKPTELKRLLAPILNSKKLIIDPSILEQSIEMDPRTTTIEHCQQLKNLGFNRVSLGIQDTNDVVLKSIRREQPLSLVTEVVSNLKKNGIELFNMDLIYGLPYQTIESITQTIKDVINFKPTRIALYSYAHVPSLKPAQKLLEKDGLPGPEEKLLLAEKARELLLQAGYIEIGMDHFALTTDSLYKSYKQNELHRNFMGYTVQRSNVLLGLGPSSLSDSWDAFAQNEKDYQKWKELVINNDHAIIHGHELSHNEIKRRNEILNLMCNFKTTFSNNDLSLNQLAKINTMKSDELLVVKNNNEIEATELGRHFIRNICMAFDDALDKGLGSNSFSKTI